MPGPPDAAKPRPEVPSAAPTSPSKATECASADEATAKPPQRHRRTGSAAVIDNAGMQTDGVPLRRHNRVSQPSLGQRSPEICKLSDSVHFHYDSTEVGDRLRVSFDSEATALRRPADRCAVLRVECGSNWWRIQRTWPQLLDFDARVHECVFDRNYSRLPNLARVMAPAADFAFDKESELEITGYWHRFSKIAPAAPITCHSVLKWLEVDKRGNRLMAAEETPINTPALAAAFAKKAFKASRAEHLSLTEGDIVSVIAMDHPVWWKGKLTIATADAAGPTSPRKTRRRTRSGSADLDVLSAAAVLPNSATFCGDSGSLKLSRTEAPSSDAFFKVGFFPSDCVQLFGEKAGGPAWSVGPTSLLEASPPPCGVPRSRLRAFLRVFLASRPSRKKLKAQGILKERVFGCDLSEHLASASTHVPLVLTSCAAAIEALGHVDGIYRLSGRVSNINRMRLAFDESREPPELAEWSRAAGTRDSVISRSATNVDVHSLASLLKAYFRELPNPLFTSALCPAFESVLSTNTDTQTRVPALHALVQSLPPPHFRTLESSAEGGCGSLLRSVNVQAVVTAYLIRHQRLIFAAQPPLLRASLASIPRALAEAPAPRPQSALLDDAHRPAFASPGKLIDLHHAQRKLEAARNHKIPDGVGLPDLSNRKCVDVNGGPDVIPEYHTVIDMPKRKGRREAGEGWRNLFGKRRGGAGSRPARVPLVPSAPHSLEEEPEESERIGNTYGSLTGLHVKGWDARRLSKRRSSSTQRKQSSGNSPSLEEERRESQESSAAETWSKSQPDLRCATDPSLSRLPPKLTRITGAHEQAVREELRQRHSSPPPPEVPPPPKNYASPYELHASRIHQSLSPESDSLGRESGRRPRDYELLWTMPSDSADSEPVSPGSQILVGEEAADLRGGVGELAGELTPEWLKANSLSIRVGDSTEALNIGANISPVRSTFSAGFRDAVKELDARPKVSRTQNGVDGESRLLEELASGVRGSGSPSREELATFLPASLGQLYRDVSSSAEAPPTPPPLPAASPPPLRLSLQGCSAQEDQYVEETIALPTAALPSCITTNGGDTALSVAMDISPSTSGIQVIRFEPPLELSTAPPVPAPRRSLSQPPSAASLGASLSRPPRKRTPEPAPSEGDELLSSPLFRKQAEALGSSAEDVRPASLAEDLIPPGELRFFHSAPPAAPPHIAPMFFV